jgi:hypothetical protein
MESGQWDAWRGLGSMGGVEFSPWVGLGSGGVVWSVLVGLGNGVVVWSVG